MVVKFKEVDLSSIEVSGAKLFITTVTRPIRKARTSHRLQIPGRPGTWDFGPGVEQDYTITVEAYMMAPTPEARMALANVLDTVLTGKGDLWIYDEPGKTHTATVEEEIVISPDPRRPGAVQVSIPFYCEA